MKVLIPIYNYQLALSQNVWVFAGNACTLFLLGCDAPGPTFWVIPPQRGMKTATVFLVSRLRLLLFLS